MSLFIVFFTSMKTVKFNSPRSVNFAFFFSNGLFQLSNLFGLIIGSILASVQIIIDLFKLISTFPSFKQTNASLFWKDQLLCLLISLTIVILKTLSWRFVVAFFFLWIYVKVLRNKRLIVILLRATVPSVVLRFFFRFKVELTDDFAFLSLIYCYFTAGLWSGFQHTRQRILCCCCPASGTKVFWRI